MTDSTHCPVHECASSTAYRKRRCRCDVCREWKRQSRRGQPASIFEHEAPDGAGDTQTPTASDDAVEVTGLSKHRITSLEELFSFFGIPWRYEHNDECNRWRAHHFVRDDEAPGDEPCICTPAVVSDTYEVVSFRVNAWEQHSVKKGVVTLYQVRASLRPKDALYNREVMERIWADFRADAERHSPAPYAPAQTPPRDGKPKLLELALMDPHLGMLAWGRECGVPYDLAIGERDYKNAFRGLLDYSGLYTGIEQILMLVGNDLFHVDGPGFDAKGGTRGGATTKGTMQDFDTRIARLFTHVRRLLVECIDMARSIAPVTIQMIPGNHDRHTVYKLGEVLNAWYRNDEGVVVRNPESVRDYYGYGANVFMFTHGEEFKRKRDNLVSVFATECPPELWVKGRIREVHVGHNHINMEKVYTGDPKETVWEGRAVRVRSLPGLTPEDSWHFESGYKHGRRATALVWRKGGGLVGLHEHTV